MFSRLKTAQLIHVTHNGVEATVRSVATYVEHVGILDDLDVRASDLLQSNGIIWVEGPSDRVYINRWIHLWTDGELEEGIHYQCVFYGGRLRAHISGADPEAVEKAVSLLRVNRHAIIVMDSDRTKADDPLGKTAERLRQEVQSVGGIAWVTAGRTIENYLPVSTLEDYQGKKLERAPKQYETFDNFLSECIDSNEAARFRDRKVVYAERHTDRMAKEDLTKQLDLSERLTEICERIRQWNNQREAG